MLTIVDYSCEEMVDSMHSNVDWEEKAHYDLICKHYCCLHNMEAVASEGRRHIRPALRMYMMETPFIIPGLEQPRAVALRRCCESFSFLQQDLSGAVGRHTIQHVLRALSLAWDASTALTGMLSYHSKASTFTVNQAQARLLRLAL